MTHVAQLVTEFHEHPNSRGDIHARKLCPDLMAEEGEEAASALEGYDRAAIARELADVTYVAYYAAHVHGIDLDLALREVHRAAIDKMDANVRRADGKIVKPPGFVPPDMTAAIA
jgi:NTP pyrophosphatase (non-canonical NTP hydrolase)